MDISLFLFEQKPVKFVKFVRFEKFVKLKKSPARNKQRP